jgi:hypothetical protein
MPKVERMRAVSVKTKYGVEYCICELCDSSMHPIRIKNYSRNVCDVCGVVRHRVTFTMDESEVARKLEESVSLRTAARAVVDSWESGDLAAAVRNLSFELDQLTERNTGKKPKRRKHDSRRSPTQSILD